MDHGKGTDGRRSPLSPSRLPLRARERRLGTRQAEPVKVKLELHLTSSGPYYLPHFC